MRLCLFQPDIPQNLGAAIRLCACLGVALDVIEPCGFPLSDRALKRVAMDYQSTGSLLLHKNWGDFFSAKKGRIIVLSTKAHESLYDFKFNADDTLVMGRESAGLPADIHDAADARLLIPIRPETRSLNLVVASAIALAEGLRQTGGFADLTVSG